MDEEEDTGNPNASTCALFEEVVEPKDEANGSVEGDGFCCVEDDDDEANGSLKR